MSKQLLFGKEARLKLQVGVNKIANAVVATLGPGGRNVILQRGATPHITKDGVTVAKDIFLEDPVENIAADIIKRAAIKTGENAGDGTTTSTVLAQELFNLGIEGIEKHNAVEIKNGMDICVKVVVEELQKMSTSIENNSEKINQVALVSSNNDKEIADMITDAMGKMKKEGIIAVDESKTGETHIEIVEGMRFSRGYVTPFFVTNQEKQECVLIKPFILLHDKKIGMINEISGIIKKCFDADPRRPILFIAEDIEGEALTTLVMNKMQGQFKFAAVRNPGYGDNALDFLEDIAVITGASIIAEQGGFSLEKADLDDLGYADKVVITKESTTIIGGAGEKDLIQARAKQLKEQIEQAETPQQKDVLKKRLAALDGGVAVLYVGGATEIEMRERKDRVDDALHATRAAVEEGIVPGGGIALARVFKKISEQVIGNTPSEQHGADIVKRALTKPFKQIIMNATGKYEDHEQQKVFEQLDNNFGFNARTKTYGDMIEQGVIDPTKVVRVAIESAVSVAGTLLTTECVSYNTPVNRTAHP